MSSQNLVRAFFGLPLPEEHLAVLGGLLLRSSLHRKFRWTRPENLHITIRFLGQVDIASAQAIAGRVQAAGPEAFTVQLGGLGAFKRGKMARVLWLGVGLGEPEVKALAARVEAECSKEGLEAEARPYHPHLTLARSRKLQGAQMPLLHIPELGPWRAGELVLYRSQLHGHYGPVYEPLRSVRLS